MLLIDNINGLGGIKIEDKIENFYDMFGFTVRNQLIIKLLIDGETEVKDINVFLGGELPSKSQKKIRLASKTCINQNLTILKKLGVVDYYRIGQVAFWYLIENELAAYMRKYITSKNFEIDEQFKVKPLRDRCNVPNLSSARTMIDNYFEMYSNQGKGQPTLADIVREEGRPLTIEEEQDYYKRIRCLC